MKTTTVDLEERQKKMLEDMAENNDIPNQSEGVREGIDLLGQKYGYINGEKKNTRLKALSKKLAWAFALIGVVWLATTIWMPVALRLPAIAAFSSSAGMGILYQFLDQREPDVSNYLRGLLRGEQA